MSQSIPLNSKFVRSSINRSFCRRAFLLIPLLFVCLGYSSVAQAVTPPPDGGYGGDNTAEGTDALFSLTTGVWNSAFGDRSLYRNATGIRNTAIGYHALYNNNGVLSTNGGDNIAVGADALFGNTTGKRNIAIGSYALYGNTTGSNNIAIGDHASWKNITGSGNTLVGDSFASYPTAVAIGRAPAADVRLGVTTYPVDYAYINGRNDVYVGEYFPGDGLNIPNLTTLRVHIVAENAVYVGTVFGNAVTGSPVSIDSNGQLGVASSSKRFKDEIKPMDKASEAILSLKPVTFRYKEKLDPKGAPQFGLVAEEVEKVNPDLVTCDAKGEVYTVRYEAVNAMLLNEFLKEHRTVQELKTIVGKQEASAAKQEATVTELKSMVARQEATIAQQQKGLEALAVHLKEQDSQIKKVSAQLEVSKLVPQLVLNNY